MLMAPIKVLLVIDYIGIEILGELAWCIDNAELLAELPNDVYERIIFCTLVPDVEVSGNTDALLWSLFLHL